MRFRSRSSTYICMLVLDLRLMTSGPTGRVDRRRLTLKTRELVAFGSTCIEALFGTLPPVREHLTRQDSSPAVGETHQVLSAGLQLSSGDEGRRRIVGGGRSRIGARGLSKSDTGVVSSTGEGVGGEGRGRLKDGEAGEEREEEAEGAEHV
jgi:hypothetical protein